MAPDSRGKSSGQPIFPTGADSGAEYTFYVEAGLVFLGTRVPLSL